MRFSRPGRAPPRSSATLPAGQLAPLAASLGGGAMAAQDLANGCADAGTAGFARLLGQLSQAPLQLRLKEQTSGMASPITLQIRSGLESLERSSPAHPVFCIWLFELVASPRETPCPLRHLTHRLSSLYVP